MAALDIRGSGGRSYVFIHGTPSDRRVWEELASLAPDGVAIVLVDLPDHGEAPDDPTASLAPLEQAALEAVEAAPGEVTVVGHSVGAWLVAALSSRMPERARHLVAISGMPRYGDEDLEMRRTLLGQLESGEVGPDEVREMLLGLLSRFAIATSAPNTWSATSA